MQVCRPSNLVYVQLTPAPFFHSASIIAAYCNNESFERQIVQALELAVYGTGGARDIVMMDVIFVAGTLAFFMVAIAYVRGCSHL
jgi:hypothetical protein